MIFLVVVSGEEFKLSGFPPCTVEHVTGQWALGNMMTSTMYAYHLAKTLKTTLRYTQASLDKSKFSKTPKLLHFTDDVDKYKETCHGHGPAGGWSNIPSIRPDALSLHTAFRELAKILEFKLEPWLSMLLQSDDVLVIYLRAGDIFQNPDTPGGPTYVQAPCNFYDEVIERMKPSTVIIVTASISANFSNPCVHTIPHKHNKVEFFIHVGTVEESVTILAHSKNIVLSGTSSYGFVGAMMSPYLSNLVLPVYQNNGSLEHFVDFRTCLPPILVDQLTGKRIKVTRILAEGYPSGVWRWSFDVINEMTGKFKLRYLNLTTHTDCILNSLSFTYVLHSTLFMNTSELYKEVTTVFRRPFPLTLQGYSSKSSNQIPSHWPGGGLVILSCHKEDQLTDFQQQIREDMKNASFNMYHDKFIAYQLNILHLPHQHVVCKDKNQGHLDQFSQLKGSIKSFLEKENPFDTTLFVWYKTVVEQLPKSEPSESFIELVKHPNKADLIENDYVHIFGSSKYKLWKEGF